MTPDAESDPKGATAFCPGCGRPLTGEARFCRGCGRPRRVTASAAATGSARPAGSVPQAPPLPPPPPVAAPGAYPTPPPGAPPPSFGYWLPAPSESGAPQPRSRGPIIAAILVGVLILGGLVIGVALLAGGGGSGVSTIPPAGGLPAVTGSTPTAGPTSTSGPGAAGTGSSPGVTLPAPRAAPPATPTAGAAVAGRDAANYNVGPGCSDNPSSSLPGCRDSPSVPAGDPEGSCPDGSTVDRQTTSCGLAQNVRAAYRADGPVTAFSPERGRSYTFNCFTGGPGTTGYRFCLGNVNGSELYVRWHA